MGRCYGASERWSRGNQLAVHPDALLPGLSADPPWGLGDPTESVPPLRRRQSSVRLLQCGEPPLDPYGRMPDRPVGTSGDRCGKRRPPLGAGRPVGLDRNLSVLFATRRRIARSDRGATEVAPPSRSG